MTKRLHLMQYKIAYSWKRYLIPRYWLVRLYYADKWDIAAWLLAFAIVVFIVSMLAHAIDVEVAYHAR